MKSAEYMQYCEIIYEAIYLKSTHCVYMFICLFIVSFICWGPGPAQAPKWRQARAWKPHRLDVW